MTDKMIITASAGMFIAPSEDSGRETDALYGERVDILNIQDGEDGASWAEIILATDGYRAWVKAEQIGDAAMPTHHVIAPRALLTMQADIKSPAAGYLPMGSRIVAKTVPDNSRMMEVHGPSGIVSGYLMADHVLPMGRYIPDYVAAAEQMIGTPYRWGGRDSFGFDCSALVQLSLAAAGIPVPRNSGDQEKAIGTTLGHIDELRRGDIVFWKGHVGMMTDSETLLHANMWHGMTASENLRAALPRLDAATGPITRLARVQ